jgi:hypothetical protein
VLNLTCPACGHTWTAPFDILAYFGRDRSLDQPDPQEVHRLARLRLERAEILGLAPGSGSATWR